MNDLRQKIADTLRQGTSIGPMGALARADAILALPEIQQMQKDAKVLAALRANGVDNWEYYDDALDSLENDE